MNRLSTRLCVVVGLAVVLSTTACADQSSEEMNQAPPLTTGMDSAPQNENMNESQPPAPAPAAASEDVSEEERKELEAWMNEKLSEGQEQEAEGEKEGK